MSDCLDCGGQLDREKICLDCQMPFCVECGKRIPLGDFICKDCEVH